MKMNSEKYSHGLSRRSFLGLGAAAAVVAGAGLAGCSPQGKSQEADAAPEKTEPATSGSGNTGVSDWLGEEPVIDEIIATEETEVLVIGSGTGGMFAACAAAEEGAKVICLEKWPVGGGIRDNLGAINSRLMQEYPEDSRIDKLEMLNDLMHYAANNCNPLLYKIWMEHSADAVNWYQDRIEERGYELFYEADLKHLNTRYKHWATGHIPSWPADAEFAGIEVELNGDGVCHDYGVSVGVDFRYECPMVKLVVENERVIGAIAESKEGYIQFNASKGVVVATGGYARNPEMMAALQPQTLNKYSSNIAIPGTTGDGIKACLWAGAAMDDVHTAMCFDRVAVKPDEVGGSETQGSLFWMGSNPWLKVNLNGERFCNESAPYDYVLNAALTQPSNTFCNIWDADWSTYLENFDIHGCARVYPFDNGAPVNIPIDAIGPMNEGLIESGHIQVADTIEELAEKLNIPAETLKATVDRQNENFAAGSDPDFGKEKHRLSAIQTPPFYGCRTSGYMLCTLDGITINEKFQAVRPDGTAIEGLYVTGVDSGSYYGHTYPNMATGHCAGRTVTFGRLIGKALAAS